MGNKTENSIKDLENFISTLTKFKGDLKRDHTKPDGRPRRSLNTEKVKALIGFEAITPSGNGPAIEWYRQHDHITNDNLF